MELKLKKLVRKKKEEKKEEKFTLSEYQKKLIDEGASISPQIKLLEKRLKEIKETLKEVPAGIHTTGKSVLEVSQKANYEVPPSELYKELENRELDLSYFFESVNVVKSKLDKKVGTEIYNSLKTPIKPTTAFSFKKLG